jgi:hypothetical protein
MRVLLSSMAVIAMEWDAGLVVLDQVDPSGPQAGEALGSGKRQHQVSPGPWIGTGKTGVKNPRRENRFRLHRDH